MKKIVLLAFILMAFMAVSCEIFSIIEIGKDKDILEVDRDTLEFWSSELRISFHITSSDPWHIAADPQSETLFCTFSPERGDGDAWVTAEVKNNGTFYHRTQEFLIIGKNDSKKLVVTQHAPLPSLESEATFCWIKGLGEGSLLSSIPVNGGTVEFGGFHFGKAFFSCDREDVSVDTLDQNSRYHLYKATVPACPTAEGRTIGFILTLTTESGELTQPYFIEQDGRNE